jgi:TRAP transporter TAXI family solute receptor
VKIPANTYKGQDKDVETAGVANYLVTHADVSDELVYQMTKLVFESQNELGAAHAVGKEIRLENAMAGVPIPLHPGAQRYFRERGLSK